MGFVIGAVIYLVMGVLVGLFPVFIDKGPLDFKNTYKLPDKNDRHYDNAIVDNIFVFCFIMFLYPVMLLLCVLYLIARQITEYYRRRLERDGKS